MAKALVELQSSEGSCRVLRQAVEAASRSLPKDAENITIDWDKVEKDDATYLPHWRMHGGTYAVTFRQADALPVAALNRYRDTRDAILEKIRILQELDSSRSQITPTRELRDELNQIQTAIIDPALNQGHGSCLLPRSGKREPSSERTEAFRWDNDMTFSHGA